MRREDAGSGTAMTVVMLAKAPRSPHKSARERADDALAPVSRRSANPRLGGCTGDGHVFLARSIEPSSSAKAAPYNADALEPRRTAPVAHHRDVSTRAPPLRGVAKILMSTPTNCVSLVCNVIC